MATGLLLALVASACFSTAGTFATSLIDAGWSPAAAVTARIVGAALLLTIPAVRALRGRWRPLLAAWRTVAGYGLLAVAGSQLAYFMAVSQLSVGVALLMEYTSPVLIVGWLWLRHGHRPRPLTLAGTGLAVAGLALVLDVLHGVSIGAVGLGWGLIAALCSAAYFLLSAKPSRACRRSPWSVRGCGSRRSCSVPPARSASSRSSGPALRCTCSARRSLRWCRSQPWSC
ncbi:hypothetical protein GCM10025862_34300 [Arsenicicoccus piscis]|uniref:EamA domain-containing protein n=1 Tax=Arsenicicoccus piscis TaxID=673954 RepID=A0ABQ6HV57_9MICO|nr:hypothetical protein GCM10025862_34300 [Arsenicicoccus piscis]